MKRVLLVDFMGSIYYHFHSKEKHIEYNFIKNLRDIVAAYKVDKVLILQEGGGSRYRTGLHPEYKSTRKARRAKQTPEEQKEFAKFLNKADKTIELLRMLGALPVESWGVEADDIGGYLCHYLQPSEYQILLLSEDSDWSQLLYRPYTVMGSYKEMCKEPLNKERWLNYGQFTEKEGLSPDTYFVKKMMIGDTSDDVPGLDGVGKGFAQQIVEMYPTVAEIISNKDTIKLPRMTAKAYASLANCEEAFKFAYQLMNLRWTEETWAEIFGKEKLESLKKVVDNYLSLDNYVDAQQFQEYCYEAGWLTFTDDEEFYTPFLRK